MVAVNWDSNRVPSPCTSVQPLRVFLVVTDDNANKPLFLLNLYSFQPLVTKTVVNAKRHWRIQIYNFYVLRINQQQPKNRGQNLLNTRAGTQQYVQISVHIEHGEHLNTLSI